MSQNSSQEKTTQTTKKKDKKRNKNLFHKIFQIILQEQQRTEQTYGKITNKFLNFIKVFIASGKKFLEDDCLTKASAIAYTTLISLIPTLTVALTISYWFNDEKTDLFLQIQKLLIEYNLQRLNITPILDAISGLIDNAASIGGIGIVVLIFSATGILRTIEKSLNSIWRIKKQRPIHLKMIYYWAALTLGPIMIITGTTVANQFSDIISETNYYSMEKSGNDLWFVGNKSTISVGTPNNANKIDDNIIKIDSNSIDFNNQKVFNLNSNKTGFVKADYTVNAVTEIDYSKASFQDIEFIGENGWIIAQKGIYLRTYNSGKSWHIFRLGYLDLLKIHMIDEMNGYIATQNGYFLSTSDGGNSWDVKNIGRKGNQFTDFELFENYFIITAANGYLYRSYDNGINWSSTQIEGTKTKNGFINLNALYIYDKLNYTIASDDGYIFKTNNAGKSWSYTKYQTYDYHSVMMRSSKNIYIGGEKGTFLHSIDGGNTWQYTNFKTRTINNLQLINGNIWAIGDSGMIMYSENEGATWQGTKGTSIIFYVLNFLAPFAFIWLLFLLIYTAFPNIHVPIKAASIGASFTASVWVAFTLLFIYYIKALANTTFAIYGALAAVPLFLLVVYFSTLIILFGAEVSYTLMYPDTYIKLSRKKRKSDDIRIINGIRILYFIYRKFETGKGTTTYKEIVKTCGDRMNETDYFLEILKKHNYISEDDKCHYLPSNSSKNIKISDLIDTMYDTNLELYATTSDIVRKKLAEKFRLMNASRKEILGEETLYDLIESSKKQS